MVTAYIGLGSNQGNSLGSLQEALTMINSHEKIEVIAVSSLYLTEPVGFEDQQWFYNCVARVGTTLLPKELLNALQSIENVLGRVRTVRWGPRTVDLDILLYNNIEMSDEHLIIPHPRMTERAFVMVPLAEIAREEVFPDGRTVENIRKQLKDDKKYSCIKQKIW